MQVKQQLVKIINSQLDIHDFSSTREFDVDFTVHSCIQLLLQDPGIKILGKQSDIGTKLACLFLLDW